MSETKTNWEKSKIIRDFRRCAGFELSEEDYVWLRQECWRARELKQKANLRRSCPEWTFVFPSECVFVVPKTKLPSIKHRCSS